MNNMSSGACGSAKNIYESCLCSLHAQLQTYLTTGANDAHRKTAIGYVGDSDYMYTAVSKALLLALTGRLNKLVAEDRERFIASQQWCLHQLFQQHFQLHASTMLLVLIVTIVDICFSLLEEVLVMAFTVPNELAAFFAARPLLMNTDTSDRFRSLQLPNMIQFILAHYEAPMPSTPLSPYFWLSQCIALGDSFEADDFSQIKPQLLGNISAAATLLSELFEGTSRNIVTSIFKLDDLHPKKDAGVGLAKSLRFPAAMPLVFFLFTMSAMSSQIVKAMKGSDVTFQEIQLAVQGMRDALTSSPAGKQAAGLAPVMVHDTDTRAAYLDIFHRLFALTTSAALCACRSIAEGSFTDSSSDIIETLKPGEGGDTYLHTYIGEVFKTASRMKLVKSVGTTKYHIEYELLTGEDSSRFGKKNEFENHESFIKRSKEYMKQTMVGGYGDTRCAFSKYRPDLLSSEVDGSRTENITKRALAHVHCLSRLIESIPSIAFILTMTPSQKPFNGLDPNVMSRVMTLVTLEVDTNMLGYDMVAANRDAFDLSKLLEARGVRTSTSRSSPNAPVLVKASTLFHELFKTVTDPVLDSNPGFMAVIESYLLKVGSAIRDDLTGMEGGVKLTLLGWLKDQTQSLYQNLVQNQVPNVITYVKVGNRKEWSKRFELSKTATDGTESKTFKLAFSTSATPYHAWFQYTNQKGVSVSLDLLYDTDSQKDKIIKALGSVMDGSDLDKVMKRVTARPALQDVNDKEFVFGPFHKLFLDPKVKPAQMAQTCTDVVKLLQEEKSVMIFGFGVSGAGKTSTLVKLTGNNTEEPGLMEEWYKAFTGGTRKDAITGIKIFVTEVYLDQSSYSSGDRPPMKLVTNTVPGIDKNTPVGDVMKAVIRYIDDDRVISPTSNNPISSRSHVLISIYFAGIGPNGVYMHVADLAGSENAFDFLDQTQRDRFEMLLKTTEPRVAKLFDRTYGNGIQNPLSTFTLAKKEYDKESYLIEWKTYMTRKTRSQTTLDVVTIGNGGFTRKAAVSIATLSGQPPYVKIAKNSQLSLVKNAEAFVDYLRQGAAKMLDGKPATLNALMGLPAAGDAAKEEKLQREVQGSLDNMVAFVCDRLATEGFISSDGINRSAAGVKAQFAGTKTFQEAVKYFTTSITYDDLRLTSDAVFGVSEDQRQHVFYYMWWVVTLANKFREDQKQPENSRWDWYYAALYTLLGMTGRTAEYDCIWHGKGKEGKYFTSGSSHSDFLSGSTTATKKTTTTSYVFTDDLKNKTGDGFSVNPKLTTLCEQAFANSTFSVTDRVAGIPLLFNTSMTMTADVFMVVFNVCAAIASSTQAYAQIVENYMNHCTKEGRLINFELESIKADLISSVEAKIRKENPFAKPYFHPSCASAMTHPIVGDMFDATRKSMSAKSQSIVFNIAYSLSFMSDAPKDDPDWYSGFVKQVKETAIDGGRGIEFNGTDYVQPVLLCVMNLDASIKDPPTPYIDVVGLRNAHAISTAVYDDSFPASHLDVDVLCSMGTVSSATIDRHMRTLTEGADDDGAVSVFKAMNRGHVLSDIAARMQGELASMYQVLFKFKENETKELFQPVERFAVSALGQLKNAMPVIADGQAFNETTDMLEKFSAKSIVGNTLYVDMMSKYGSPAACYIVPGSDSCAIDAKPDWNDIVVGMSRMRTLTSSAGTPDHQQQSQEELRAQLLGAIAPP